MTREVAIRTKTTIGSASHLGECSPKRTIPATHTARARTPNQPLTARTGRSAMSTRTPSCPTGVALTGDSAMLMATPPTLSDI